MMARALVIAELHNGSVAETTRNAIGAARRLPGATIDVAVLGDAVALAASQAASAAGVARVLVLERPENTPYLAAVWAPQLAALARGYTHVFAAATTFGKDLMPRTAALSGASALSDITAIDGSDRFSRPIYAGNAIAHLATTGDHTVFATIRPSAFTAPGVQSPAPIEPTQVPVPLPTHTRFVERRNGNQTGPDLQSAATVVAGGRGLGGQPGIELLSRLASVLDAAFGGSRAAVDAGWLGNDRQIGQTGKIIAPELYFGVGISGAIQHLTGIKDAGTIVAINKDADAPICRVADIVLVDDLFAAVPELIEKLGSRKP